MKVAVLSVLWGFVDSGDFCDLGLIMSEIDQIWVKSGTLGVCRCSCFTMRVLNW